MGGCTSKENPKKNKQDNSGFVLIPCMVLSAWVNSNIGGCAQILPVDVSSFVFCIVFLPPTCCETSTAFILPVSCTSYTSFLLVYVLSSKREARTRTGTRTHPDIHTYISHTYRDVHKLMYIYTYIYTYARTPFTGVRSFRNRKHCECYVTRFIGRLLKLFRIVREPLHG